MNPLKAWNAKLEAVFFGASKNLYRQCEKERAKLRGEDFYLSTSWEW